MFSYIYFFIFFLSAHFFFHIDELNNENSSGYTKTKSKRTRSGLLKIHLNEIVGLPNKKSVRSEVFVVIKVDGVQKTQSKASRNKWNEDLNVHVEKAQEIEVMVYEKGGDILAFIWFKLTDLESVLRLAAMEKQAELLRPNITGMAGGTMTATGPSDVLSPLPNSQVSTPEYDSDGLSKFDGAEMVLDLEPSGRISMKLNFLLEAGKLRRVCFLLK